MNVSRGLLPPPLHPRPIAAAKFDAHFERMWYAAQPMIEFEPAIKALEPK